MVQEFAAREEVPLMVQILFLAVIVGIVWIYTRAKDDGYYDRSDKIGKRWKIGRD
jgi:hypothetical protein